MPCICNAESGAAHSQACADFNAMLERRREAEKREIADARRWEAQAKPCSGSGFAHKAHGQCPGYATDRT